LPESVLDGCLSVSKSEQQNEIRLEIRLPQGGYGKTMYFNRLRVEHEPEFCVLPRLTLEHNQKALLEYLGRSGSAKLKTPLAWQGTLPGQTPGVADIISMAYREDMAETCFCVFSMTVASGQRRTTSTATVDAQPLALLRSSVELQRQLIASLYEQ